MSAAELLRHLAKEHEIGAYIFSKVTKLEQKYQEIHFICGVSYAIYGHSDGGDAVALAAAHDISTPSNSSNFPAVTPPDSLPVLYNMYVTSTSVPTPDHSV